MFENKLSILNWYIEIMEEGIEAKEISQKYIDLKNQHAALITKTDKQIA